MDNIGSIDERVQVVADVFKNLLKSNELLIGINAKDRTIVFVDRDLYLKKGIKKGGSISVEELNKY